MKILWNQTAIITLITVTCWTAPAAALSLRHSSIYLTNPHCAHVDLLPCGNTRVPALIALENIPDALDQMEKVPADTSLPAGAVLSLFDLLVELTLVAPTDHYDFLHSVDWSDQYVQGAERWTSRKPRLSVAMGAHSRSSTATSYNSIGENFYDFYMADLVFDDGDHGATLSYARNSVVPEPGTTSLLCLGALGMGIKRRWHQG